MDNEKLYSLLQELKINLSKLETFDNAIQSCLELHSLLHSSEMSGTNATTYEDELWEGLNENMFCQMPLKRDTTIAWCIWHLSRIEDITTNILIANDMQVFHSTDWGRRMNTKIIDTGNVMSDDEIIAFSNDINIPELRNYRIAVGRRTREIIKALKPTDLKRKMDKMALQRILDEGAVLDLEGANWLIGYWGSKTVSGLLLMPITKHLIMHLNEAKRIKIKCQKLQSKIANK